MSTWRRPLAALIVVAACGRDAISPSDGPPARLDAASQTANTGPVGTALPAPLVVKVKDAGGRPVVGATVTFAITQGFGSVSPRVALTDRDGVASTTWVLGTTLGVNEVTAAATPIVTPIKFTATTTPGPVKSVTVTPQTTRILNGADSVRLTAGSFDAYGNVAVPAPTFTPRDPTLVSVDSKGFVHVRRRGGATYVVATAGDRSDSALVTVLGIGESICTGVVAPTQLAVGQVITEITGNTICVRPSGPGEEYALIPYYNSVVPSATTQIEVRGLGLGNVANLTADMSRSAIATSPLIVPNDSFELALRERDRREMAPHVDAARAWYADRRKQIGARASRSIAAPVVGDLMPLNVNSSADCTSPDLRTGRVMAITNRAIIVADTANPAGGFTDEEYQSIGVTFDTLVDPVDVAAFGQPSDIDGNGRSILFFTRAVNAITPRSSSSVVLGFFYGRDLRPKTGTSACLGSNFGEMFYLLVPDPNGTVSEPRSKGSVLTWTNGTVAHEYQHLINASRRLYVNPTGAGTEETWLNEGLSHIAEELTFFRSAGLSVRANLGASAVAGPTGQQAAAYATYEANNFARFRRYLQASETQSPVGFDAFDDDLATRGAIWSFLRYAADHQQGTGDGTLWFQLVNGGKTGLANLADALGSDPARLLRDWSISVYMDDNAPNVDPRFQQPSWNLRSAMPAGGNTYALGTRTLIEGFATTATMTGGGAAFLRFSVAASQDALLTVTSSGQIPSPAMQLSVVRIR